MNSTPKHSKRVPGSYIEQLHILLHSIQTQVWYLADDHTYGMVNKAHAEFNGKEITDIAFRKIPEEILLQWQKVFKDVFSSNETIHTEELIQNSSGEYRLLSVTKSPGLSKDGSTEYVLCSAEDITEQNRMQEDLLQSAQNFRATLENLYLGVVVHASDSSILLCNTAATRILGLTMEQMKGKQAIDPVWRFVYEDLSPIPVDDYPVNRVVLSKEPLTDYLLGIHRPDRDHITWVIVNALPIFTKTGALEKVIVNFTDITKRRRAEESIRRNQKLLSSIAENYPNSYISIIEKDLSVSFASGQEFKNQNLDPDQFVGLTMDQIFGDQADYVKEQYGRSFAGEELSFELFLDGLYLLYRTVPLIEDDNTIQKILVVAENITEKKLAEEALKASEEKFRTMYDNAPLSYQSLDREGCFLDVNPTWLKTLGYLRKEVIGNNFGDFLPPESKKHFRKNFPAFKKRGFVHDVQYRIRHKDGHYVDISFEGSVGYNDDESFKQTYCVFQDITGKKLAEKTLKETEKRFTTAFESTSDSILIWDKEYNYLYANQAAIDHVGSNREDVIGKNIRDGLGHIPEFMHLWMNRIDQVFETGKNLEVVDTTDMNGKIIHTSSIVSPILDDHSTVVAVCVVYRDITDVRNAEEALQRSEKQLRNIFQNSTNLYYSHTPDHVITYVSPQVENMLGYTLEEVKAIWTELASDNPINKTGFENTVRAIETGERQPPYELELIRKDGKKIWVEIREFPEVVNGKTIAMLGSLTEITERRRAVEELKSSEERFRLLYENSPDMYVSVSAADASILRCNKTLLDKTGYLHNEVIGSSIFDMYHADAFDGAHEAFNQYVSTGRVTDKELILKRKDGSRLPVSLNVSVVRDKAGKVLHSISSWRDISQRKQAEESVRESEQRFRTIFENKGTATGLFKEDGIIQDCNAVFCELTGYSRAEITGRMKWSDFMATEDIERMQKYHSERTKKGSSAPTQYECRLIAKNGRFLDVIINIAVIEETRIVSLVDITDRKKANLEIQRMQRLEGLGTIAGGIAHDFNNLLTGIFANLEMAKMDLPENSSSSHYLQEAHHSILSARRLTGQLLTFAKGGAPVFKIVDMTRLIQETVEFNLHGTNVKPEIELQDNLWSIMADEGQIEQVLGNLTINSKQAMPCGGALHVAGRNLPISEAYSEADLTSDSILLTIKDEGIGIPPKIIDHIFDPYFSTKETGHGLGLAIVYSIIKQHKGHISVSSEPNTGTTFTIILPAVPETGRENADAVDITRGNIAAKSSFHILLMDDEEIARKVATQLLERLGHTTDTAVHGDEAIKKYTEGIKTGKPFDLVIMDLTIRDGKGGKKTIEELLKIYPEAKVIVSSGYSSGPIMANFSSYGFSGKLAKPFMAADLQDTITLVMNRK